MWAAESVFAFLPFVMVAVFCINESMNNSNDLARIESRNEWLSLKEH